VTQELGSGEGCAAEVLGRHDVDTVFTLSGGHLFPFYDGCVQTDIRLVDVRHEQTATFAAEGWAKVTRRVGVCRYRRPGVTNGVSALTAAQLSGSPMLAIGGRAPSVGVGLAQELDPVPILSPVVKHAATAPTTEAIPATFDAALRAARTRTAATFVDVALDVFVNGAMAEIPDALDTGELAGGAPGPRSRHHDREGCRGSRAAGARRGATSTGTAPACPRLGGSGGVRCCQRHGPGTLPADHDLALARSARSR
jgi:acetolactate synthase-1/2/3 large subunit